MSDAGLIMMILWTGTVTTVTVYLFYRVLTSGGNKEEAEDEQEEG